jgi:hypothetical protein
MTREIAFAPSSHIQAISYDDENMLLFVTFKKSRGVYKGVPEDVAMGFENTISAGNYLNEVIKPTYEFERAS